MCSDDRHDRQNHAGWGEAPDPFTPAPMQDAGPSWTPTYRPVPQPSCAGGRAVPGFWLAIGIVVIGNLLIHLWCQNWRLYDPARGHAKVGFALAIGTLVLVAVIWEDMHRCYMPIGLVVLPSLMGGLMAVTAGLSGLASLETFLPGPSQVSIFSDIELLGLPCFTVTQLTVLLRRFAGD